MLLNELQKIGLSENEAKIYIAALELGSASLQELTNKTGIKRTTVNYVVNEILLKNKVLKTELVGKRKVYIPTSPEGLYNILDKKITEIDYQKNKLKNIIPDLQAYFYSFENRPRIRYFDGPETLNDMTKVIISYGKVDKYLNLINIDDLAENPGNIQIAKELNTKLMKLYKNIDTHFIIFSKDKKKLEEQKKYLLRTFKNCKVKTGLCVEGEDYPRGELNVYNDDSVFLYSVSETLQGLIIENNDIVKMMKFFFNKYWEELD